MHLPCKQLTESMLGIAEQSVPISRSFDAWAEAEKRMGATSEEAKGQPPPVEKEQAE